MNDTNDVYYRLLATPDGPHIVEMQWFDEADYDQPRFLSTKRYNTQLQAEGALLAIKLKTGIELTWEDKLKVISILEGDGE